MRCWLGYYESNNSREERGVVDQIRNLMSPAIEVCGKAQRYEKNKSEDDFESIHGRYRDCDWNHDPEEIKLVETKLFLM